MTFEHEKQISREGFNYGIPRLTQWIAWENTRYSATQPLVSDEMPSGKRLQKYQTELLPRAQLFEGWLSLNPELNLTRVSFSFVQKHFLGQFSLIFIAHRIINLLTKRIKLTLLYKLSYLNSNFALTLGCLNPALNNPAQIWVVTRHKYDVISRWNQWWRPEMAAVFSGNTMNKRRLSELTAGWNTLIASIASRPLCL